MATNTVYVFAMKDGKYAFKTEIRHVTPEFSARKHIALYVFLSVKYIEQRIAYGI
jgi:hypothetical protein